MLQLYDNAGKMMYLNEEFNTSDEIKLADLAKGVYFLKITENDGRYQLFEVGEVILKMIQ
jgi:hypothetical protein